MITGKRLNKLYVKTAPDTELDIKLDLRQLIMQVTRTLFDALLSQKCEQKTPFAMEYFSEKSRESMPCHC